MLRRFKTIIPLAILTTARRTDRKLNGWLLNEKMWKEWKLFADREIFGYLWYYSVTYWPRVSYPSPLLNHHSGRQDWRPSHSLYWQAGVPDQRFSKKIRTKKHYGKYFNFIVKWSNIICTTLLWNCETALWNFIVRAGGFMYADFNREILGAASNIENNSDMVKKRIVKNVDKLRRIITLHNDMSLLQARQARKRTFGLTVLKGATKPNCINVLDFVWFIRVSGRFDQGC